MAVAKKRNKDQKSEMTFLWQKGEKKRNRCCFIDLLNDPAERGGHAEMFVTEWGDRRKKEKRVIFSE